MRLRDTSIAYKNNDMDTYIEEIQSMRKANKITLTQAEAYIEQISTSKSPKSSSNINETTFLLT